MDKTDRLRDYGLAFLLYEQGLGICGYELIRELFIFTKLILNSYLMYECLWEDLPLTKKLVSQLNQRTDDLHDWQTILVQNRQIFRIP